MRKPLSHGFYSIKLIVSLVPGGLLSYRTGELPEPISCAADLRVIIVNTKVERNTLHMITIVKQKMEKVCFSLSKS
jgi:hypothetical protein